MKITDVGAALDPQFECVGGNEGGEMTHEEMVAMAREAGLGEHTNFEYEQIWELKNVEAIERFAALVTAAERERCALICEKKIVKPTGTYQIVRYQILMAAAKEIRKGE